MMISGKDVLNRLSMISEEINSDDALSCFTLMFRYRLQGVKKRKKDRREKRDKREKSKKEEQKKGWKRKKGEREIRYKDKRVQRIKGKTKVGKW